MNSSDLLVDAGGSQLEWQLPARWNTLLMETRWPHFARCAGATSKRSRNSEMSAVLEMTALPSGQTGEPLTRAEGSMVLGLVARARKARAERLCGPTRLTRCTEGFSARDRKRARDLAGIYSGSVVGQKPAQPLQVRKDFESTTTTQQQQQQCCVVVVVESTTTQTTTTTTTTTD